MRLAPACLLVVSCVASAQSGAEESAPVPDVDAVREKLLVGNWSCDNAFVARTGRLTRVVTNDVVTKEGPNLFRMLTVSAVQTEAPEPSSAWPDTGTREPRSRAVPAGDSSDLSFVDEKRVKIVRTNGRRSLERVPPIDVTGGRIVFSARFLGYYDGSVECVKR
jgi:hypothetical protein